MILPVLLIGGLLATLIGAGAHLLWGKKLGSLASFMLASWLGFWLGHWAGIKLGWGWLSMGRLYAVPGVLLALALVVVASYLEQTAKE